ncbi:helix-turn-helix domain-containing protein [Lactococcus garvieae]|uniref:helix-turn-helix domain-containing protein n=1 Tax=Lactococcus garvieae TaxID=1363 RepID=UPI003854942B
MPYLGYGEAFRRIREQKQLPLSYFSKLGVDKTDLSRFERGMTMMGVGRVDALLQSVDVSLAEYELIVNNFIPDFQEEFLLTLEKADLDRDEQKLKKLYEEARSSGYYFLSLASKARFCQLNEAEITRSMEFLNGIKIWGYFELCVSYFILDNLSTEDIIELFEVYEEKNKNYLHIFKYRRKMLQTAYHSVIIFSSRGEQGYAQAVLENTGAKGREVDIYIALLRRLAQDVYMYCFEDKVQGLTNIKATLFIFDEVDYGEVKTFHKEVIEKHLNIDL